MKRCINRLHYEGLADPEPLQPAAQGAADSLIESHASDGEQDLWDEHGWALGPEDVLSLFCAMGVVIGLAALLK